MDIVQQSLALKKVSQNGHFEIENVGKRIRTLRLLRGMSVMSIQEKLRSVGNQTSRGAVYKIERGTSQPTLKTCELLAEVLSVTVGDFFSKDLIFGDDAFVTELFASRYRIPYSSWVSVITYMKDLSSK